MANLNSFTPTMQQAAGEPADGFEFLAGYPLCPFPFQNQTLN